MATVSLVTRLVAVPWWRVGVSPGEDGGRGYVIATGDGRVEFTGEWRRWNAALSGQQRNCRHIMNLLLTLVLSLHHNCVSCSVHWGSALIQVFSPVSPAVEGNSRAGATSLSPPPPPPPWCLFLCLLLDFRGDSRTPPSPCPSPPRPFRFRGSVMSRGTRISTGSPPRDGRGEHFGVS